MLCVIFFFFKQKTAYEMRISDWSSDVCSSDLVAGGEQQVGAVRPLDQHVEHLVEALAVIFGRIVRIEPDMDIGDLCDQHIRPLLRSTGPTPQAYPPRLAACKEGVRHVTS